MLTRRSFVELFGVALNPFGSRPALCVEDVMVWDAEQRFKITKDEPLTQAFEFTDVPPAVICTHLSFAFEPSLPLSDLTEILAAAYCEVLNDTLTVTGPTGVPLWMFLRGSGIGQKLFLQVPRNFDPPIAIQKSLTIRIWAKPLPLSRDAEFGFFLSGLLAVPMEENKPSIPICSHQ